MIPNSQQWDFALIDHIFQPYDASAIKNIPLSSQASKDRLYWLGSNNGQYSVKTGYRFLVEDELKTMPSSSSTEQMNTIRKSVWSLQVPRKIQMFMWRALKDSLPTKLNLKRRHILKDPVCELCRSTTEDILHMVWRCPQVQAAWNKFRVHKPTKKPDRIASFARGFLEEFRTCQTSLSPSSRPTMKPQEGTCIATLSQKVRYPQSVDNTEALAARRAIQFALELGLHSVDFEGDSTRITDALNVAHALACRAKHYTTPLVWMDTCPPELEPLLRSDILP
uniref:Reverse transcriptase zinc-binding domain-containing protein n=1 Tax=Fagus sylvatica TaxID=28930 RepID=A0A2N9EFV9_FAGSY